MEEDYQLATSKSKVNKKYLNMFKKSGLIVSGTDLKSGLIEIMELKNKRWFLGCQFHPEFTSRPDLPNRLFSSFVKACREYNDSDA